MKLTQQQMMSIVMNDDKMSEEYLKQIGELKVKYSRNGCTVNGKKVGIQTLILTQKRIAQSIYEEYK